MLLRISHKPQLLGRTLERERERERERTKSKDDIKYFTAQARLNEDEAVRVAYKHGTPLEGGKLADSEPVDLFSSAHNIQKAASVVQDENEDPTTQP
ncbi:uncharacterized protein LOC21386569 [Morus notabilis]|uniref:uncharacterized protein LOC21386569 n=1 Tax=Morus notabilis TaxID=981085 RepID=UPI000CED76A0|nr:uncharacterized protein LOC21386569 [Morus notabilis]